ncbi:hypothetical protein BH10PSE11_BH10PSE11_30880 [soil metagenome]
MPRFFFDVADGITVKDSKGLWCRDAADAKDKAIIIAKHVAKVEEDITAPPRHISVLDSKGREVGTVIVRDRPIPIRPLPKSD